MEARTLTAGALALAVAAWEPLNTVGGTVAELLAEVSGLDAGAVFLLAWNTAPASVFLLAWLTWVKTRLVGVFVLCLPALAAFVERRLLGLLGDFLLGLGASSLPWQTV